MKNNVKNSILAALGIAVIGVSIPAEATNGYFAHGYGIKAKGMAGAGVAYSQDALAAATNPAGMVNVGNRWDVGAELFIPDRTATTSWGNGLAAAATFDGNGSGYGEAWFLIPEFGYNRMIDDTYSLGISVFGNGGMNTSYTAPIFSTGLTGATPTNIDTGINLEQLFISPTLSIKLDENNSLGIALNVVYQRFEAKGLSDFTVISTSPANLTDVGVEDSYGFGFRLGWQGKLTNTVTAGFTYQPRINMKPFEKYKGLFAEGGDFDIPTNYALGLAWQATPAMTVALDVEKIKYSQIKSIANPNTFANLGAAGGAGFGWEDMDIIKLGVAYQYSKDLVLRAGWNHGGQPIPATQTLFNVIAPATVEDHITLGFTWTMKNGGELSGFYMHAMDNTINGVPGGSAVGMGAFAPGAADIGMSQDSIGIAYGKKF
jgi:long-chain fatty acid transport protein